MNKVCHITSVHTGYDMRIFYKECKTLANLGLEVTLLVNDDLPDEEIDRVEIISIREKIQNRRDRIFKLREKYSIRRYI